MKLKFKNQDFQTDAVNAVIDLFAGQEKTRGTFSVETENQTSYLYNAGVGNALVIDDDALEANMHAVQKRNKLPLTEANWKASRLPLKHPARLGSRTTPQFCIEMETGTGKTYVYTKTIFELNRKYGLASAIHRSAELKAAKPERLAAIF